MQNGLIISAAIPVKDALDNRGLYELSLGVGDNRNHRLHRFLNNYPPLPFEITQDDLNQIEVLLDFPEANLEAREWTPFEKIFFANLWKDAKLKGLKKIIKGVQEAINEGQDEPRDAIAYNYLGRHLVDLLNNPIIDQHTYRAFRLLDHLVDDSELTAIRRIKTVPSAEEADAYCEWYRGILRREEITCYQQSRKIDSLLFALGKYAKLR